MTYTPQTWADGPSGNTPITAAALNHIESGIQAAASNTGVTAGSYTNASITVGSDGRITAASSGTGGSGLPEQWYSVKSYGAVGDNSADDTTAIQNAINAVKANVPTTTGSNGGRVLYFPPGYYRVTSPLNFQGLNEVHILGFAGKGIWRTPDDNPPTAIAYWGSGTAPVIDMRDSQGCVWDGVAVLNRYSGFTGDLISLDALAAKDMFGHKFTNCTIKDYCNTAAALVSMAGCIECSFENVHFGDSGTAQVRMVTSTAPATWSNANSFRSCSFSGVRTYSVLNPGPQTTWMDCTFEPTGTAAAPIMVNSLGNENCTGLTWLGCGFWDNTSGTTPWIESTVATSAFAIVGGKYSVTGNCFSLSSHTGLSITGTRFDMPGAGPANVFDPAHNITNGSMLGCYVTGATDNHTTVFV